MSNKIKTIVLLVLVGLLVGVVKVYSYMDSRHAPVQTPVVNNETQIIQKEIDKLYLTNKKDFLIEEINQAKVSEVENKVNGLNVSTSEKKALIEGMEDIKTKTKALEKVNALFAKETPAIKGNKVETDLQVLQTVTLESFKKVKEEVYFEEPGDKSKLDAFELAINKVLDSVLVQLGGKDEALALLEEIKGIPIEDGQIGRIASKMKAFEDLYDRIEDENVRYELDIEVQDYIAEFITKTQEIAQDIPGYYDLLTVAVEPSRILSEAVFNNKALFGKEDSTEVTEAETESQSSHDNGQKETYSDPKYYSPVTQVNPPVNTQPQETAAPTPTPEPVPEPIPDPVTQESGTGN